jgi:hypothetical protein
MAHRHATISAWTRDSHQGFYTTEMHGFVLRAEWRPGRQGERGGFLWVAEREGDEARGSAHAYEEIEEAMADAEHYARAEARRRTTTISAAAS